MVFIHSLCIRWIVLVLINLSFPSHSDTIIDNYYEAIGGYEKLKSVETIHSVISHREKGLDAEIILEIYGRRPNIRRVNWSMEKYDLNGAEGYTGSTPWEVNTETGRAEILTGAKGDAARRGAEFDESFVDAHKKGHKVSYIGTTQIFGRETHQIRVILHDGWIKNYFFEKETSLILGLQKSMPVHGEGEAVQTVTKYRDYRDKEGLLIPHKFEEYNVSTGEWMSSNEILSIDVNTQFPDSLIDPPNSL